MPRRKKGEADGVHPLFRSVRSRVGATARSTVPRHYGLLKRLTQLAAICSLALTAKSQETTALPSIVTIETATQEALDKNLTLLAERYRISVADARIITARLRPNPVVTLVADHLDLLGTHFNAQNNAGPAEYAYRTDFVLERGGKRERRIAFAEADRSAAELAVLNSVRTLLYDVNSAFVDVQLAKEAVALAQQSLKALNDIVDINGARVRSGDLAQVELVRSRLAALQFNTAVQQAQLRLKQAKNRLQLLLGRNSLSDDFDVSGEMRRETKNYALDEVRTVALQLRPDLRQAQREQARSQADLRLQLAQGKVDYTVGTEYRRQQGLNGTGNSLGFFVSVPLPVFNRNQGEIERARLEQEQLSLRIRAVQAAIGTEVTNAYQQYTTNKDLLDSIEKNALEQARNVRQTTEYSYRRGEASLIEFLDAQRAFNDAVQSYNEVRAEYARSLYLIDSVSGRSVTP